MELKHTDGKRRGESNEAQTGKREEESVGRGQTERKEGWQKTSRKRPGREVG